MIDLQRKTDRRKDGAMMLWVEIHTTPADDAESEGTIDAFEMDRDSALDELGKLLGKRLDDAAEGDELIATITVQDVES